MTAQSVKLLAKNEGPESIPGRDHNIQTGPGDHPAHYGMGDVDSFPGGESAEA
jgi:hypothetical protein